MEEGRGDNASMKEASLVPNVEQLHITNGSGGGGGGGGQLSQEVKDLGRKARARLEEERNKRPEIVCLAVQPADKDGARRTRVGFKAQQHTLPNKRPAAEGGASTSLQKPKRRRPAVSSRPVADKDVDRWIPRIHHLPDCTRENRSNVVRLHGLPKGTTPGQIKRFMSGLDPQRIFVLPSNSVHLIEWDANHNTVRKRGGVRVHRYSGDFRVYVKFQSGPTAELAAGRSGEIISLDDSEGRNRGASVGVTQVVKSTASYILRHMAIDADPSAPLEATLANVEAKLDPEVSNILWTTAIRELNLEIAEGDGIFEGFPLLSMRASDRSLQSAQTEELLHRRNTLTKVCDRLSNQSPFPSAELLDPTLVEIDPIMFLTVGAVQCLRREIERMDDMVQQVRRWRLFGQSRGGVSAVQANVLQE